VVELIRSRCTEVESGARMVDAILSHTLLPEISGEILSRMMEGRDMTRVHVGVEDAGFVYSFS
jgi:type VI secretion system protein VasG